MPDRLDLGTFEEARNGVPLRYRISNVPEHLVDAVVDHMVEFFLPREPMCSSHNLAEDPESVALFRGMWRNLALAGGALVAVRDGPEDERERVVGANITYITTKEENSTPEELVGKKCEPVYHAVMDIAKKAKIYETYGVDKYLTAFGLSVHSDYHGYKIGEHLLEARKPLCEALGVKVTGTVFTAASSQYLSKKVGFKVLYEESYKVYTFNGKCIFEVLPGKFEQSAWDFS